MSNTTEKLKDKKVMLAIADQILEEKAKDASIKKETPKKAPKKSSSSGFYIISLMIIIAELWYLYDYVVKRYSI